MWEIARHLSSSVFKLQNISYNGTRFLSQISDFVLVLCWTTLNGLSSILSNLQNVERICFKWNSRWWLFYVGFDFCWCFNTWFIIYSSYIFIDEESIPWHESWKNKYQSLSLPLNLSELETIEVAIILAMDVMLPSGLSS